MSGGPDSLALLVLAAENRDRFRRAGFALRAATVDHGLRPEAAAEAEAVARLCRDLGVPHAVLMWEGRKPAGNLAAEARAARYRLLADHARALGAPAVLAAHHEDDQIETHRLAAERRAGDRGLAAMRQARALAPGLLLLRPFLRIPGARLKAAVAARGIAAADDPTNRDPRSPRARLRLAPLSEAERREALRRIARHAARRDAEDAGLAALLRDLRRADDLAVDARGLVRLRADAFRAIPPPLADLLLGRVLRAAGGAEHPPLRRKVRALAERLHNSGDGATLGGAAVVRRGDALAFFREYGRSGIAALDLAGAGDALFDRRLRVSMAEADVDHCPRLAAFGATGRGNAVEKALPVALDRAGAPLAAHPALLGKLPAGTAALAVAEEVTFRIDADLPIVSEG